MHTIKNFWRKEAKKLYWNKFPTDIFHFKKNNKHIWFKDGKLNACYNAIDSNINAGLSKKIAIHFLNLNGEIKSFTYEELLQSINSFIYFLKNNIDIKKINKIMIHSSTSIESAISMLSCARLGITHSVIFEDLESEAIYKRLLVFKPDILISRTSEVRFKNTVIPAVNKYSKNFNTNKIKVFYFTKKLNYKNVTSIDFKKIFLNKKNNIPHTKCKNVKSDKDLFALFTSGSTGIPKCIVHSTGGYLTYIKHSCKRQFGINKKSTILTASDAGWINGHTYALYGPLMLSATSILLENPISILDRKILEKIIYKLNPTILYLPVTLIRLLKSLNNNNKTIKSNIEVIGSMGEALAPRIGKWYSKFFNLKNRAIVNTYFQTETGAIISSPTFKDKENISPHGTVGKAIKHLGVKIINKEIIITNPWPGCMKNIFNEYSIWKSYWTESGFFKLFDTASLDGKKNIIINGRLDDVMNIRGHRIGSAEIESILLTINSVIEVCAVSIKEELEGSVLILFIVSNDPKEIIHDKLKKILINNFGTFAIPKKVFILKELPKTKSGKILRRILRNLLENNKSVDLSAISNKEAITDINNSINSAN